MAEPNHKSAAAPRVSDRVGCEGFFVNAGNAFSPGTETTGSFMDNGQHPGTAAHLQFAAVLLSLQGNIWLKLTQRARTQAHADGRVYCGYNVQITIGIQ